MSKLHFVGILALVFLMAHISVAIPMNFMNSFLIYKELSPELRQNCTDELINWCKQNVPSAQEMEKSAILIDYIDVLKNAKVTCSIDSDGTNCMKNMFPWFHCYPDGSITYKGTFLDNSTVFVDDDICDTKETALKLDNHLGFDEKELETEVENYLKDLYDMYKQLSLMRNMIDDVRRRVNNISPGIFDANAIIAGITSLDDILNMWAPSENTVQTASTKLAPPKTFDEDKTTVKPNESVTSNVNESENTVDHYQHETTVKPNESGSTTNVNKNENTVENNRNEIAVKPDGSETAANAKKT